MARLSLAQQQMVEIAKALSFQSRLVILDEPTSSLPIAETEKLLEVIAGLKAHGISVIFISHRLHEVVEACDRVLVLRDGKLVGTLEGAEINHDAMVRLMVGRDLKVDYVPPSTTGGEVVLSIKGVRTSTYPGQEIDLDLHAGEILGLAGLVGAGRTELARALFGIDRPAGGSVALNGQAVRFATSSDAVDAGIFLVPEDRKGAGLLLDFPIAQNISLPNLPRLRSKRPCLAGRRAGAGETEPLRTRHPRRRRRPAHVLALGRQPAEGRARQMAGHEAQGHHLRRADAGHRRRARSPKSIA